MTRHGQTQIELFQGTLPGQREKRIRFHCRFQTAVHTFYRNRPRGFNKTIRLALGQFNKAVAGGKIRLKYLSRFLAREDVSDKTELCVRITVQDKDYLEKMAFAFRLSQAEVLRMALEWYMEAINPCVDQRTFDAACRKWHHDRVMHSPSTMWFSFKQSDRLLEWQFPSKTECEIACKITEDHWPNRFYGTPPIS